jgi:hypothetical protein
MKSYKAPNGQMVDGLTLIKAICKLILSIPKYQQCIYKQSTWITGDVLSTAEQIEGLAEDMHTVAGVFVLPNGERESHVWIEYFDWIIDPSAHQFIPNIPVPYVVEKTKSPYHRYKEPNQPLAGTRIVGEYSFRRFLESS